MNQKKKARRARGLGSDSGLDLAISRFTNSLVYNTIGAMLVVTSYHVDSIPEDYSTVFTTRLAPCW
jgi:hypothetical protein